ncbi:MAG: hypothetical protein R3E48_13125 [Burkholderiaceae bacterium]
MPLKLPLVPLTTVTSAAVKFWTGSLKVNVNTTAPLAVPLALSEIVNVGGTAVSNAWPLSDAAVVFELPARSWYRPAAIEKSTVPVVSDGGRTTTSRVLPEPLTETTAAPPVTVTSVESKPMTDSLKLIV